MTRTNLYLVTALAVLIGAADAQAQNAGAENRTGIETGQGVGTRTGIQDGRSIELRRGAGVDMTLNAAGIILPAMASLRGDPAWQVGDVLNSDALGPFICEAAEGNQAWIAAKLNDARSAVTEVGSTGPIFLQENDIVTADALHNPWSDHREYQFQLKDWEDSAQRARARGEEYTIPRPEPRTHLPRGVYKVRAINIGQELGERTTMLLTAVANLPPAPGSDGAPAVEIGRTYTWDARINQHMVSAHRMASESPEQMAVIDAQAAAWTRISSKQAMPACLGYVARQFVVGSFVAWPTGLSRPDMAAHAKQVTAANLALHELAKEVATRIGAAAYRDPAVAQTHAVALIRQGAPLWFARYRALRQQIKQAQITLNMTGGCGYCWQAALPNGSTYAFEGSGPEWRITLAGGAWGGGGWLAGVLPTIRFTEGGATTIHQAEESGRWTALTWEEQLSSALGFGSQ